MSLDPFVFSLPLNNVTTTLAASRSIGATSLTMATGYGATIQGQLTALGIGSISSTNPLRFTLVAASVVSRDGQLSDTSKVAIYTATGRSGDTLTGVAIADGTTDQAFAVGDYLCIEPTFGTFNDVHAAINSVVTAINAIGTTAIHTDRCYGDSMTDGYQGTIPVDQSLAFPAVLSGLLATAGKPRTVVNSGVDGETSSTVAARFLADLGAHPAWANDSLVIWVGRNDPMTTDGMATVRANIASMITALAPGNTRFVVMGITNTQGELAGSPNHDVIVAHNKVLASLYPSNFFDVRQLLIDGYNPSIPEDVSYHDADAPPTSLLSADRIHPNTAGYALVAGELQRQIDLLNDPTPTLIGKNTAALLAIGLAPKADDSAVVHIAGAETVTGVKTFSGGIISPGPGTGTNNSRVGLSAGANLTTGSNNALNGDYAGYSITTGSNNAASGFLSLFLCTTGSYNFGAGTNALDQLTIGISNWAGGYYAGHGVITGSQNTYAGVLSGLNSPANAQSQTLIGYNAQSAYDRSTVIGHDAVGTSVDEVVLGTVTDTVRVPGVIAGSGAGLTGVPTTIGAAVTGGMAGRIPFWGAGPVVADDGNLVWDASTGTLTIGSIQNNSHIAIQAAVNTGTVLITLDPSANVKFPGGVAAGSFVSAANPASVLNLNSGDLKPHGNLTVTAGSVNGQGSIILKSLNAPTGPTVAIQGASGQTAPLQQPQDSVGNPLGGTTLKDGSWQPPHLADSAAASDSLYYSTTQSKLCYKDSGGVVNNLY